MANARWPEVGCWYRYKGVRSDRRGRPFQVLQWNAFVQIGRFDDGELLGMHAHDFRFFDAFEGPIAAEEVPHP